MDFATESELSSAEINWGEGISAEIRPFFSEEDVSSTTHRKPWWKMLFAQKPCIEVMTTVSQIKPLEPDFSCDTDFEDLTSQLLSSDQIIGRLNITGRLSDSQYNDFQAPHPSGEELNFRPDKWSLSFDEINLSRLNGWDLESGEVISEVQIGMMSFSLDGYGYFYPWTFREWVEKFTVAPGLKEVCDLCRQTWPVESMPPSDELVKLRRECEELWAYDDIYAPIDWAWGPYES